MIKIKKQLTLLCMLLMLFTIPSCSKDSFSNSKLGRRFTSVLRNITGTSSSQDAETASNEDNSQNTENVQAGITDNENKLNETASNAFNFRMNTPEWVNSRSGTVSCTTTDITIPGRNGFNLIVESSYDQFSDEDRFHLGKGWRLNFTYMESDHTIYLGSGQAYTIVQTAQGLKFKNYKGKNISLYHDTTFNGQGGNSAYRVDYFGGSKEYLDARGNMICSMDKFDNKIEYIYSYGNKLSRIIDTWGNIVKLEYKYNDNQLSFILPDDRVFSYVKTGNTFNKLGSKVDFEGNTTYYKYSVKYGIINEIHYPTGLKSVYTFTTLKTSNGGGILAVKSTRDYPVSNNPEVYSETKYDYSENNYTGYPHKNTGEDPLIYLKTYTYKVSVTQNDVCVEYTYNNLHQVTTETVFDKWKENVYQKTEHTYPSDSKNYDDIKAHERLPEKSVVYYYKQPSYAGSTLARTVKANYEYNEHEQLVKSTDTDGVVTSYTYDSTYGLQTKAQVIPTDGTPVKTSESILSADKKSVIKSITQYKKNNNTYTLTTDIAYDQHGRATSTLLSSNEPGTQSLNTSISFNDNATIDLNAGMFNVQSITTSINAIDCDNNINTYSKTNYFHKESGLLLASIDGRANMTQFEYNDNGQLIQQINADGTLTQIEYKLERPREDVNKQYNEAIVTNTMGYKTRVIKDGFGRPKVKQEFKNGSWHTLARYEYDKRHGSIKWQEDAFGNRVSFFYDELLRLKGKRYEATGDIVSLFYDTYRNRQISVNEEGEFGMIEYDNKGRETASYAVTDPNSITPAQLISMNSTDINNAITQGILLSSKNNYNDLNQLISSTDTVGNTTTFHYDDLGRQVKVIGSDNNIVDIEYNLLGKVTQTQLTDTKGTYQLATSHYNELGQLISATDQLGLTEKYKYDAIGNIVWKQDRKGNTFSYTYNNRNKLTQMNYTGGSVNYTYNDGGQIASMIDSTGTYQYIYNADGTLQKEIYPDTKSISYKYNAMKKMVEMQNFSGKITTYEYDSKYQLVTVKEDGNDSLATTYSYYADGLPKESINPAGVVTSYSFDRLNNLTSLDNKDKDGTLINNFSYTYDKLGNRLSETSLYANSTLNTSVAYTYDKRSRLTESIKRDYQNNIKEQKSYQFDTAGNITQVATLTGTTSYTYNTASQMIEENSIANGTINYQYDANGNLTHKNNLQQYHYDNLNRLNKFVNDSGEETTYNYRADGLRISKSNALNSVYYYYHNKQIVNEEINSQMTNCILGKKLISREYNGAKSFYVYNAHGDTTTLVNSSGNIVNSYEYEDYGDLDRITETVDNPFKYNGQYHDKESGLYYLRARYYSPTMRRFITVDPIKDGHNWYAYCGANPINYSDPSGLKRRGGRSRKSRPRSRKRKSRWKQRVKNYRNGKGLWTDGQLEQFEKYKDDPYQIQKGLWADFWKRRGKPVPGEDDGGGSGDDDSSGNNSGNHRNIFIGRFTAGAFSLISNLKIPLPSYPIYEEHYVSLYSCGKSYSKDNIEGLGLAFKEISSRKFEVEVTGELSGKWREISNALGITINSSTEISEAINVNLPAGQTEIAIYIRYTRFIIETPYITINSRYVNGEWTNLEYKQTEVFYPSNWHTTDPETMSMVRNLSPYREQKIPFKQYEKIIEIMTNGL